MASKSEENIPTYDIARYKGVVVLGISGCPFCKRAAAELDAAGVPFTFINVQHTFGLYKSLMKEMLDKHKHTTVPIVLFDGELIGGATQLTAYLGDKDKADDLRKRSLDHVTPVLPLGSGKQKVLDTLALGLPIFRVGPVLP